jgi:maltose O-acetyltransferase
MRVISLAILKSISWLPQTRSYRLKARLLRLAGVQAHPACRVVSSAKFLGTNIISIGDDTYVGHDVMLIGAGSRIDIGNDVDIGPRVLITTGSHEIDMVGPHTAGEGRADPVRIEDGAWVGAGSVILGGVTIGRKSVIAAGSVVNKSIPPCVIAAGVPSRPIKRWNEQTQQWEPIGSGTTDHVSPSRS